MAKYVTVGFDRESDAERFINLVKGAGLLIQLYQHPRGDEGAKVNNIQARGIHEWTPRPGEARRFEVAGVVTEFKDEKTAHDFLVFVASWMRGELHDTPVEEVAKHLAAMLDYKNIAGVRMEKG